MTVEFENDGKNQSRVLLHIVNINCLEPQTMRMNVDQVLLLRPRRKKDPRQPLSSIDDLQVCNPCLFCDFDHYQHLIRFSIVLWVSRNIDIQHIYHPPIPLSFPPSSYHSPLTPLNQHQRHQTNTN